MQRLFTLEYWIDEGWYVGKLKEVPGVFSQGSSLDELEENIREVYALLMEEESLGHPGANTKDIIMDVG
ncbi:MAG: type II toxin-antitoxin system HicB family antitoxin [Gammaproteobacteria bacterium]